MAWRPPYTDLPTAKGFLKITHNNDDAFVTLAIAASSRAIDKHCGRQFGNLATPVSLRYRAWYSREICRWFVNIRDIYSSTGLAVTVDGTTVTEYDLLPETAAMDGRPWERIMFRSNAERLPTGAPLEVGVLGLPGWAAFPDEVVEACHLQVSRLNARRTSPFGIAGSPQAGSELRLLERLDPDVAVGLKSVMRRWAVA